jgi:hypothetical protein
VRNAHEFLPKIFFILQVFLTCREIFRHGTAGFVSLPKEVVLRIFIALKNPSSAGFEPANLGSSGKHNNHYTTEDFWDIAPCTHVEVDRRFRGAYSLIMIP